jgi:repressor LexA
LVSLVQRRANRCPTTDASTRALLPENREGFLTVDRRFLPSGEVFSLRVKGDSMIGRAILDGDFVLLDPTATAKDGDIVAARIGEEATIKTYRSRSGTIVLEPANPAERDMVLRPGDNYAILGVCCGVFRAFVDRFLMPQAHA